MSFICYHTHCPLFKANWAGGNFLRCFYSPAGQPLFVCQAGNLLRKTRNHLKVKHLVFFGSTNWLSIRATGSPQRGHSSLPPKDTHKHGQVTQGHTLNFSTPPLTKGNVTPDFFSDHSGFIRFAPCVHIKITLLIYLYISCHYNNSSTLLLHKHYNISHKSSKGRDVHNEIAS